MWSKKIKFGLGGLIILTAVLLVVSQGQAKALLPYTLEVPIGGETTVSSVADYIDIVYQFLIGIAGVVATVMIMFGGWQWIFAGGNETIISSAKERITSAIIGLVLALSSYLILFTINPALVELTSLNPTTITPASGCIDEEEDSVELGDPCEKDCQCKSALNNRYGKEVPAVCQDKARGAVCVVPDNNICAWQIVDAVNEGQIIEQDLGGNTGCDASKQYACLNKEHVPVKESGTISSYIIEWYCQEYSTGSLTTGLHQYTVGNNYSMCSSYGGISWILWGNTCRDSVDWVKKANDEYGVN